MTDLTDLRIFVCTAPIKMNFSFDRLMGLAQETFEQDPLSGHLFIFFNRQRDRIKILFWDQDGFCIWYKRLELDISPAEKTCGCCGRTKDCIGKDGVVSPPPPQRPIHAEDPRLDEMLPDRWAGGHPEMILTYRLEESRQKAARQRDRRQRRRVKQRSK